jgi:hypothetical protein
MIAIATRNEAGINPAVSIILAESQIGRVALYVMQRNICCLINDLQPALRCRIHQIARDLGLAIDGDMLAGQFICADPNQPLAIGNAKAVFEQAFLVQPFIDIQPVQQVSGGPLQHACADAAQYVVGACPLHDNAVDALSAQQMAEQQSRRTCTDYGDLRLQNCCSRSYGRVAARDMVMAVQQPGLGPKRPAHDQPHHHFNAFAAGFAQIFDMRNGARGWLLVNWGLICIRCVKSWLRWD